jgi:hypothetical protein
MRSCSPLADALLPNPSRRAGDLAGHIPQCDRRSATHCAPPRSRAGQYSNRTGPHRDLYKESSHDHLPGCVPKTGVRSPPASSDFQDVHSRQAPSWHELCCLFDGRCRCNELRARARVAPRRNAAVSGVSQGVSGHRSGRHRESLAPRPRSVPHWRAKAGLSHQAGSARWPLASGSALPGS